RKGLQPNLYKLSPPAYLLLSPAKSSFSLVKLGDICFLNDLRFSPEYPGAIRISSPECRTA
ncbi:MAG TPA: hypothetical protein VNO32_48535, partial [Candidatus Acidoferrum sp.]|nr:hypothetical protein [Candidatus Acidoferrum sp.]